MTDKPKNPPAFPQSYVGLDVPHEGIGGGMTLRDYFAGQALTGLLPHSQNYADSLDYAETAYAVADAMLEARLK